MNLDDLKLLSAERLKDARALLQKRRYSFAYYAAGYAVECALKACVLSRMTVTGWVFATGEKKKSLQDVFTHDFQQLIAIAGLNGELSDALRAAVAAGTRFPVYWETVNRWAVDDRYVPKTRTEAEELFTAITAKPDGVLLWIKTFWRTPRPSRKGTTSSGAPSGAG